MTLTLAVETSSFTYEVALVDGDGAVIAHESIQLRDPAFRSIGHLAESMMHAADRDFCDLSRLAVDVGPGNVISVRAGVSYVNGLAFSLKKPVHSADSLTLLAAETGAAGHVLCLRNAGAGNVNAGLFRDGVRVHGRHGQLTDVVPELVAGLDEVTVAGVHRERVQPLVPGVRVHDSGIEFPAVLTLARLLATGNGTKADGFATPVTDASALPL